LRPARRALLGRAVQRRFHLHRGPHLRFRIAI
jgi:hypothetical protein